MQLKDKVTANEIEYVLKILELTLQVMEKEYNFVQYQLKYQLHPWNALLEEQLYL